VAFETTVDGPRRRRDDEDEEDEPRLSLVLIWAVAPEDQERLGEVIFPDDGAVFGRGVDQDDESRVGLFRQVPSKNARAAPIEANFLSRRQLKFSVESDAIGVEALGKRGLRVNDAKTETRQATLREGDVFEIDGLYAFYCARRPLFLEDGTFDPAHRFGRVDDHGIVGESPAAWSLRTTIAFVGKRNAHVLITGSSGTGKELIAQAIHRLSSRAKKELVARNAATFPSGLIDAELFGNVQNYPNVGMPERPGLIGQAHDSTLFLDEIGELPIDMQAHLLRVLDHLASTSDARTSRCSRAISFVAWQRRTRRCASASSKEARRATTTTRGSAWSSPARSCTTSTRRTSASSRACSCSPLGRAGGAS